MEIRVIDFGILTKHYKNYQDGVELINKEKEDFLKSFEPIKKQLNQIINAATSGLIIDSKTQQQKAEEFQNLQREAMEMEQNLKYKIKTMSDELNSKCYDELEIIVTEWAKNNSIDLVTGKMEVIFSNDKYDSTNDILEILKQKELYIERQIKETEKESF